MSQCSRTRAIARVAALSFFALIASCANVQRDVQEDTVVVAKDVELPRSEADKLTGGGSLTGEGGLFGGLNFRGDGESRGTGIGVNAFLWRASLDTSSFMPLASADPFGGVIITDWYVPLETTSERFKLAVYILDKRLRSDALRVALWKQERKGDDWIDAEPDPETTTKLENLILTRARELRQNAELLRR